MPSVDYDLVILGGTLEGRFAAALAAGYGARVALIEPPKVFAQRQQVRYLLRGLQQLAKGREYQAVADWFNPSVDPFKSVNQKEQVLDWAALLQWSAIAADTQLLKLSPEALSARGVDFIEAMPEALSRQLVVTVGKRSLSTRAVLAAFGTVPSAAPKAKNQNIPPNIPAITGIEPLLRCDRLPTEIAIWGNSFIAVDWAEALSAFGGDVTLVTDLFLQNEDRDVREIVRSQLLSAGIKIINSTQHQPSRQTSHISLQLGQQQPALVLPDFTYPPHPGTDSSLHERPLSSNHHLQTAHPRIFACGSLLRRSVLPYSIAQHEAKIAVSNALFLPIRRPNYKKIVQAHARFAKIGETPTFASADRAPIPNKAKANRYQVFSASMPNSADLSRESPRLSYCKIICQNNQVHSIHLLGESAENVVAALAPILGRPITELLSAAESVTGPLTTESLAALVRSVVWEGLNNGQAASKGTLWQPGRWRRDWAENWFNWRRSAQRR